MPVDVAVAIPAFLDLTFVGLEALPGPGEWAVPDGCFDVAGIAREYVEQRMRVRILPNRVEIERPTAAAL